jgi:hypothetical protein
MSCALPSAVVGLPRRSLKIVRAASQYGGIESSSVIRQILYCHLIDCVAAVFAGKRE